MEAWQDERLEALLRIRTEQDLFDELKKVAGELGFEYCAYGIRMPVPVSRPKFAWFNNYSDEWRCRYEARGYFTVDPTVQHGLKSVLPIVWSEQHLREMPEFWEEARNHGLRVGWAQASRDAQGTVGMLTLARSNDAMTASEMQARQAKMGWLVQYAHTAMAQLLLPKHVAESRADITAREQEVLRWTAEGKTAYEIGMILSVSERTVNFHINNVVAKLGASNKTQAAVKAVALGLLA